MKADVIDELARWSVDPLAYVLAVFPWGERGLPVAGPHPWQREVLAGIGRDIASGRAQLEVLREAIASGHGVGKSALVSWLVLWAMTTMPGTRGVVTANTESQLRTKTWAELGKWHGLLIEPLRGLVEMTATALLSRTSPQTWRIDAVPWSVNNPEAFAGLHNAGKRIIVVYDEASAIDDAIWEVTEGALTDARTEIVWLVCGNPTRKTGRFADCWGRFRSRWRVRNVDARGVPGTSAAQIAQWIADYGEDSDFVRVRVRGLPPQASASGFFPGDLLAAAMTREARSVVGDPLIMGVDVSRGGDDDSVIAYRRGLDARTVPWVTVPGGEVRDSMRLVDVVADLVLSADVKRRPDVVLVDETGVGGPIVDRLRQVMSVAVYGVNFAGKSPDAKHANMRMTMYWRLREALQLGLAIPADPVLERELSAIEYQHDRSDRMLLVPKDRMRAELGFSPDRADALAITYGRSVGSLLRTQMHGRGPIMIRRDVVSID